MKRFAVMVLAACLCLNAACALAFSMTGLETETVNREWETNRFFSRMTALTGIETTPAAEYEAKEYDKLLDGMLKGSVPVDVLFKANLTRAQERALLESGALIDLAPLLEENMPNLSALLAAHPEWYDVMTHGDGRIATLPLINEAERQICLWINQAWLDALNLEMPKNVQELTDTLLAFKTKDPNGNYKEDEVAADLLGVYEMRWLLPYFSIIADDYHLARDAQGQFVFAPELEGYRDFVALLAQWNQLGIFDEDAFTTIHQAASLDSSEDKTVTSGLIVTVAPYTHIPAENACDYVPLLMAGPDGSIRWRDALGEVWTGCFAVTSACEEPEKALAWVDALYAQEGAILAYAGEEGTEFAYGEDGRWVFLTDVMQTIDDIRSEAIIYTGTAMPGLAPAQFLSQVDSDIDVHILACMEEVRAVSEQVSAAYLLDEAAQARANAIMLELGRLVDAGIGRFATGETALTDENWNDWLASLKAAGSEELTALFNAAITNAQ